MIGQAIARRVSAGKHILLADLRQENADTAAKIFNDAGFSVSTTKVDVSSRASVNALVETAKSFGQISGVIHAAGVSPSQASPETILKVDLYGTALVLALPILWILEQKTIRSYDGDPKPLLQKVEEKGRAQYSAGK